MRVTTATLAPSNNGTLRPEAEDIARFIAALFAPDDLVELRPIETWIEEGKKQQRPTRGREWLPAAEVPHRYKFLYDLALGPEHANIFFGICPRPQIGDGTKDRIRAVRCLWQDLDNCTTDEALFRVEDAGFPRPSIVIASGHGAHLYWLLHVPLELNSSEDRERIESDLARLAHLIGGDATQDVSRLYRLPNLPNVKNARNNVAPSMCKLRELNEHRYDLAELEEYLPEIDLDSAASDPPAVLDSTQELNDEIRNWAKEALSKPAKDGTRSEKDFAVLCDLHDHGWTKESCRVLTASYSKFAERTDYFDRTWQKVQDRSAKLPELPKTPPAIPSPDGKSLELPKGQSFSEVLDSVRTMVDNGQPIIQTLPTGLDLFDSTVGGLPRGEFVALVGQPGCGKTSLVDRIVVESLRRNPNARAIVFSLETENRVRACRLIAAESVVINESGGVLGYVPVSALLRGTLRDSGRQHAITAQERLKAEIGNRLQFIDSAYQAVEIARIIRIEKPAVIALDHLGLVMSGDGRENETVRMDNALGCLVAAIREVQTAAIIVNELSKGAMVTGSVDMSASRGTIRFASLAAMYLGLLQLPQSEEEGRDPRIAVQLRKNRFGPSNLQQVARFFGGYSYFGWDACGPIPAPAKEEKGRKD